MLIAFRSMSHNIYTHFGPFLGREPSLRQLSRNRTLNTNPSSDAIYIDGTGSAEYDQYFSPLLRLLSSERVNGRNLVKSMTIVALDWSRLIDHFNCHAALRSFPDINDLCISNIRCSVDELESLILSFPHLTSLDLERVAFDYQVEAEPTQPDSREQYSNIDRLTITQLDANSVSVLDLFLPPSPLRFRQLRYLEIKGSSNILGTAKIPGTTDIMHRIGALSQATSGLTIGHISISGLNELNLTIALAFDYSYIFAVQWWTEVFGTLPATNALRRLKITLSGSWAGAGLSIGEKMTNDWNALDCFVRSEP
ncbi:uncharacterized protein EV420DRAFT_1747112 [Desarmillaria tabescens]|uniref:F-box domain-containing protein n=1 Tax=Armillaria tabescens TaxID=1929756 RepID=A0AA39N7C0_ARMTA|nr:uncharacterized protein EV420DRAFT_1747112 [Desarmillaria tabescens]KAK0460160.1 hypothetical protein EV420DRAFT_1747112 [Desarmillaria tabescens]